MLSKLEECFITSYDGTDIYELVGLYILENLSKKFGKADGGSCSDNGVAAVNNSNGPLINKLNIYIYMYIYICIYIYIYIIYIISYR